MYETIPMKIFASQGKVRIKTCIYLLRKILKKLKKLFRETKINFGVFEEKHKKKII